MTEPYFWLGADAEAALVELETYEQLAVEAFVLDSTEEE